MKNPSQVRIKILLDYLGISQKVFAASIGIRHEAISRYIHFKSIPGRETIQKIADTYNVDPAWLMGYGNVTDLGRKGGKH